MPSVSQAAWWTITAVLVLVVWRRATARGRWAMGAWAVVLALGPVAFETVAARRVGLIWQGRYSIPTLAGLAAFVSTLSLRVRAVQALAVGATTIELCAFWATLRRATVGTDGSWWFTGGPHGRWVPPVPALALLIAHVALIGGVVWFVAHRRARNHEGARGYLM